MVMDYRTRRDVFRLASEAAGRDDRIRAMRKSSELFVEQFAYMPQQEREAWVHIQSTAESISKSGAPVQRMRIKTLKADVEEFLAMAFSASNLQECDIVTQNEQLTQILLKTCPSMEGFVARLEVQRFCHLQIRHP
jgi:hypothetical protein